MTTPEVSSNEPESGSPNAEMVNHIVNVALNMEPEANKISLADAVSNAKNAERNLEQNFGAALEWCFQQALRETDLPLAAIKSRLMNIIAHVMQASREYSKLKTLSVLSESYPVIHKDFGEITVMEPPKSTTRTIKVEPGKEPKVV